MVDTNFAAAAPPSQSSTVYDPARRKHRLGLRRAPIQTYQPLILWSNTRKTWSTLLHQSTCAANVGTKSARHFGVVMQTILAPTEHAIGQNGEGIGPRQQVSAPVRKRMANLVPWPRQEGAQFASPWRALAWRPSQEGFSLLGEKPDLTGSFWVSSGARPSYVMQLVQRKRITPTQIANGNAPSRPPRPARGSGCRRRGDRRTRPSRAPGHLAARLATKPLLVNILSH